MEDAAYLISNSIITLAFLCVAARLLHRSLRTRAAPERLLGVSFLLWGLSYPLFDIPYVLGVEEVVLAPLANASRISWQAGSAVMALFVQKTFRHSDPRATWLVVGSDGSAAVRWNGFCLGWRLRGRLPAQQSLVVVGMGGIRHSDALDLDGGIRLLRQGSAAPLAW